MADEFEAGRRASAGDLTSRLPRAPLAYLHGALANAALVPDHLLLILKNPGIVASLIAQICGNRGWIASYDVKAAIVLHSRTPRSSAMNLVSFLWWRDLARVTDRAGLAPPLRRAAERLLATRLQEMALGEKISLARIASRGVVAALRRDGDPMVIRALLQNPRLIEDDVLSIASATATTPSTLRTLAEEERWVARPSVRKAIARNPQTPRVVALRLIRGLSTTHLRDLARAPRVPVLVKVAAQRLIESRSQRNA
jgi:hypothetical protein